MVHLLQVLHRQDDREDPYLSGTTCASPSLSPFICHPHPLPSPPPCHSLSLPAPPLTLTLLCHSHCHFVLPGVALPACMPPSPFSSTSSPPSPFSTTHGSIDLRSSSQVYEKKVGYDTNPKSVVVSKATPPYVAMTLGDKVSPYPQNLPATFFFATHHSSPFTAPCHSLLAPPPRPLSPSQPLPSPLPISHSESCSLASHRWSR